MVVNEKFTGKIILDVTSLSEFIEWPVFDHPKILSLLGIFRQPKFNVFLTPLYEKPLYNISKERKIKKNLQKALISAKNI